MSLIRSARVCCMSFCKTLQSNFSIPIIYSTKSQKLYFQRSYYCSATNLSNECSRSGKSRIVTYGEIVNLKYSNNTILVDVRESDEIKETGQIPTSIHIPVGSVEKALKETSDDVFRTMYSVNKPSLSEEIIFYCKSGVRSKIAMDAALKLGFENARSYKGSWEEWVEKQKKSS